MRFVVLERDAETTTPIGGKARALADLRRAELPIPKWFVLIPAAFDDSLSANQRSALIGANEAESIRKVVDAVSPNEGVQAELRQAIAALCPDGEPVAVRSSASDEDGAEHSFAGQLDSFLFVSADRVTEKVTAVWRSGFSDRIVAYRREHGLRLLPRAPAVLIQRMVQAEVSGVAFGADPVSGRRCIAVIAAVYGLGTALVSGECDADTWQVDREGNIVHRAIADKRIQHIADSDSAEGVRSMPVPSECAGQPALSDEHIHAVAELVRKTSRHFGRPQDIEWAIEAGKLFLLQSRPITSLEALPDPDGTLHIWDNSNIAESYNGVTTPLTFSFARRAYEEVYRQFCRILRVPEPVMARNDHIFPRMLGMIRGRIYYNLLNWYRLLAMLPGYQVNRGFMEQMMGVKEGLPDAIANELPKSTWRDRVRDTFRFMRSIGALIKSHFTINGSIRGFYRRLKAALGEQPPDLPSMRADELAAYYRNLESQLLKRWDAPLINDFLAMIFYGTLRKLTAKWCGDAEGSLQNDLLCGEGGMISAEPAHRVREMAEVAVKDPALVDRLCEGGLREIQDQMKAFPKFQELHEGYLAKFGDRCMEELKLESATLDDDPLTLLRSVGQLARRRESRSSPATAGASESLRVQAEARVRAEIRFRPIRRMLFNWVLKNARARVRDRENLRFERTRLFGRVRRIFVELGRRYYASNFLEEPRDIFDLEVEEALGFIDGTCSTTDLKSLVAVRKAEFARFRQTESPAERFETHGVVHQGNRFQGKTVEEDLDGESRKGLGCCPGVVRGPVRVITDPRNAFLQAGDILVAERTDPGWIMLFPSASGLLVERGSLLSHSAIVAREMSIPAIVSIPGVTRWLRDGDQVEMNGATGVVIKVDKAGKVDKP